MTGELKYGILPRSYGMKLWLNHLQGVAEMKFTNPQSLDPPSLQPPPIKGQECKNELGIPVISSF